ncbi:hypothetical protein ACP275_14G076400 [Erythranthe tilingii]
MLSLLIGQPWWIASRKPHSNRGSEFRCCMELMLFMVCRDPRWGRCYESFGEDPHIVKMMTSMVTGLQGQKLHDSHFLLTEILKNKLGFKGFIISDSEGLDRLSSPHGSNYQQSVLSAINAGIDMVMVPFRFELFIGDLMHLVESGKIAMKRIDDAVERILRVKFASGLFEHPFSDRSLLGTVRCEQHKELAREAVRKSLVLLKNGKDPKKPFLPLDRNAKTIFVAGRHADDLGYQCGGWTMTWEGKSGRITTGNTILDAIREVVGDETEVIYDENPSAGTITDKEYSFAIVVVGEGPYVEFGGDSTDLTIHFNGTELISMVAEQIPTLAILISGRPLSLEPQLLDKTEALVSAWLPGSEGGRGIVDVIFGDHEFQGRLPLTWFKNVEQLPMHVEDIDSYDPLFPIGFGLTSKNELLM